MRIWRVPYRKFGDGPGLARVAAIAKRLGIELSRFGETGAVVVGSNGKGSTAAMTASLLRQSGRAVGLFTSPHLFDLNERFNIDGEDIGDEELDRHWRRVAAAIEMEGLANAIGGFEFLFLIAADWFAARKCAYTVWEAGIGGRHDPVRLIEAHRLAMTALDLEHTELLGDTLEEIARDKLDAAPRGARVFVGASCAPQRLAMEAHCTERGARVEWTAGFQPTGAGGQDAGGPPPFEAPLRGEHQRENAALALALARDLCSSLSDEMATRGFAATHWPGRLEVINANPLVVIDVGHTPEAVRAALKGFEAMRGGSSGVLVCGASHDKKAQALIGVLAPSFPTIICAAAQHKGTPAPAIAAYASAANPSAELAIAESVAEARSLALARARAIGAAVYVAGGLFLAAEFKAVHLGRDPHTLAFF